MRSGSFPNGYGEGGLSGEWVYLRWAETKQKREKEVRLFDALELASVSSGLECATNCSNRDVAINLGCGVMKLVVFTSCDDVFSVHGDRKRNWLTLESAAEVIGRNPSSSRMLRANSSIVADIAVSP